MPDPFTVHTGDVVLSGEESGTGAPVILLHGLTATRRYVVMGSRSLERSGHRVISYDARGHGESSGGGERITYSQLADDLEQIMDACAVDRALLAGVSMGAHTLVHFALTRPDRVAGLMIITPAYDGHLGGFARWDRLAAGLRTGGIDGFLDAYDLSAVNERVRATVTTVIRQRMARHRDLAMIARALEEVPRSRPFEALADLGAIRTPTVVVASGDGADPEHPQRVGEAYAAAIPGARVVLDHPDASPVAWQGSQVSRLIAELALADRP